MDGEVEAVNGSDSFMVCVEFALGGLAVMCLQDDEGMFGDACVSEV